MENPHTHLDLPVTAPELVVHQDLRGDVTFRQSPTGLLIFHVTLEGCRKYTIESGSQAGLRPVLSFLQILNCRHSIPHLSPELPARAIQALFDIEGLVGRMFDTAVFNSAVDALCRAAATSKTPTLIIETVTPTAIIFSWPDRSTRHFVPCTEQGRAMELANGVFRKDRRSRVRKETEKFGPEDMAKRTHDEPGGM